MAASGYTPIQLYHSTASLATPLAADLATGELAFNVADGKIYYKDMSNNVQLLVSAGTGGGTVTTQYEYPTGGTTYTTGTGWGGLTNSHLIMSGTSNLISGVTVMDTLEIASGANITSSNSFSLKISKSSFFFFFFSASIFFSAASDGPFT